MQGDWVSIVFEAKPWRATGTSILKGLDDIQMLLDDQIVKTQSMRASPYIGPFEDRVRLWEGKLNLTQEILDQWLKCQQGWLYLEPIFGSDDIMQQMPNEGRKFKAVDGTWRRTMEKMAQNPEVLIVCSDDELLKSLVEANKLLDQVQKGLNEYLETKRLAFPRFYFLSNDELLEILSETKDPTRVQPFLRKIFEGINSLEFQPNLDVTAMVSEESEKVPFVRSFNPKDSMGSVERWLIECESAMRDSLKHVLKKSFDAYATTERVQWIVGWPGQVVLAIDCMYWTKEMADAINGGVLSNYAEQCTEELMKVVAKVRGQLTKLERKTLSALIVVDVHARDVAVDISSKGVVSELDFEWMSQLRYMWENGDVSVRMINAQSYYGYEYLGNSGRLVITPLTDRCYRTLMGALHLSLGGAPEGPAGTGKTETTKDLAKAIAMQCVVFNCSDGLDYQAMGKLFKGLASSGAWACFDEFNRIDLEVLSVVAQQILTMQRAKAAGVKYAGRSELPDNLKALFRSVAMMVPDYALISEIMLYSSGYMKARDLARKLVATYKLCSEQLSSQSHYDYGMRAVISVLRAADANKQKFGDADEDILMLRSIKDVNAPKFLAPDVPLFEGILSDLFPGVDLPEADYSALDKGLLNNCEKLALQPTAAFIEKAHQLYEMILVRHGLMLVGYSYGAKTSIYKALAGSLADLEDAGLMEEHRVQIKVMNPKSIYIGQLYGQKDPVSQEWKDGVLAQVFRSCAVDTSPDRKWIMFDGPVDAVWIENMNTVLDDNKKLCLNSGEIIQMSSTMNMIFEVQDLAVASPATASWMHTLPEGTPEVARARLDRLFAWLVDPCVGFVRRNCRELAPTSDIALSVSLMSLAWSLLDVFRCATLDVVAKDVPKIIDGVFVFSLIWSIGGSTDNKGRAKFSDFVRKLLDQSVDKSPARTDFDLGAGLEIEVPDFKLSAPIPKEGSVYDFVFEQGPKCGWTHWMDTTKVEPPPESATFNEIIIPTIDTVRYAYLMQLLVSHRKHLLLVGPTGTGKTIYVKAGLDALDRSVYQSIETAFSAQTNANQVQDIIDAKLDKRRKGIYGPPFGMRTVIFVDDLNMPALEVYGAQPPIELLRQWMDHGGWYDRSDNTFRKLEDVQFVSAMGPPGGGRNSVTPRFVRHFNLVTITEFDDETYTRIYSAIADWRSKMPEEVSAKGPAIVKATIEIYNTIRAELLPTPAKSHYTYNMRDLSKVFQGMQMVGTPVDDNKKLCRLCVKDYILVARRRMHAVTDCRLSDRFGLLEAVPPEGADAQAEYDAMAAAIREEATNHLAPRGSRRRRGWQFTLSQRTLRLMDARQRAHTAWLRSKSAAAKRERNRANRAADAAVQRDRERWIGQQVAEAQDMLRKKNLRQFARACDRLAGRSRSHQIPPAMRDVSGALHSGPDGVLKAMTESFDKLYGGETKLSDETLNQLENDVAAFELTRATEVDEAHGRPPDLAETEACVRALRSAAAPGGDQLDAMLLRAHETLRVLHDRLVSDDDRTWYQRLLRDMVNKHLGLKFDAVFEPPAGSTLAKGDVGVLRNVLFCDFMTQGADNQKYEEMTDLAKLLSVIEEYLSDYNAQNKSRMDLVLFLYAAEHICRISRIIKQPYGNALLVGVGGSGRQSLSRIATFMAEFALFSIEITKSYTTVEWREDLRRVLKQAGAKAQPTVFLFSDTQLKDESFLEDINNILNTGEVPSLFPKDELVIIMEAVTPRAKRAGKTLTPQGLYAFFVESCRQNLHLVLAMSPVGSAFRERLRKFPSLVNCTTIDWFSEWPADALKSVASRFLHDVEFESEHTRGAVEDMCMTFHQTVRGLAADFMRELQRPYYATPTSYLELIQTYKDLLGGKRKAVGTLKRRYEVGLDKLLAAEADVNVMKTELIELQPKLIVAGKEVAETLTVVARETVEATAKKEVVLGEEAIANEKAAAAKEIKDECEGELAVAMPLLEAALNALNTLSKNDITEVKSMKSPPTAVKLVMEAVCILLSVKASRINDPNKPGSKINDFWGPSQALLGQANFMEQLQTFDKDNIPAATVALIKPYVDKPEFEPELVKKASKAAYGLCCWVRAMEAYDRVAKARKKQLEYDVDLCEKKLDRATKLIGGLGGEKTRWTEVAKRLGEDYVNLTGDVLLSSGFIAYLGAFTSSYRYMGWLDGLGEVCANLTGDVLLASWFIAFLGAFTSSYRDRAAAEWVTLCTAQGIPCANTFGLVKVLGDPVKIRDWTIDGLPNDSFSIDNGIMMAKARRWPLLIDPQGQTNKRLKKMEKSFKLKANKWLKKMEKSFKLEANKWLKKMEKSFKLEANKWLKKMEKSFKLEVLKMTDGDYVRRLENCIQFGYPVLLENVGEELDPTLEPLLLKSIFKQGGSLAIRLGDSTIEYSENFRFYITTKLRNPHYLPEVSVKVTLINFMITQDGLEDQLLGIVVMRERPELEEEKTKLVLQGAENARQLKEIEDKIIEVLSSSEGNILEDETAINVISSSKTLSNDIASKQVVAEKTERKIDDARMGYKPVARHVSVLFFTISELAAIEPMYQYSLTWFVNLFDDTIAKSEKTKDLTKRIANLIKHFTYSLYINVCRSLFEKDKLLFSFSLTCAIMAHIHGSLDMAQFRFLLTGGISTHEPPPNPSDFLADKQWVEMVRLDAAFADFGGLADSFKANQPAWHAIYGSADPTRMAMPEPWGSKLSAFQKLVLTRLIRPDKLIAATQHFVEAEMGRKFVEPPPFDLDRCFGDSSALTPLIFVLSPGVDPMAALLKFAETLKISVESISLGQGQGPKAARLIEAAQADGGWVVLQGPKAARLIEAAQADGGWVVLQNCHLATSWMPTLERICERLSPDNTSPHFRLWLTSYPSPQFPVSVLQNGIKMTNDPPKGLRANLLGSYVSDPVNDPAFFNGCTRPAEFKKLLFGLCFFHAFVQERLKFGPLGWNVPYQFSSPDFVISVRQLQMFLNEFPDMMPLKAIKYLTGECNYGGRVTDAHDRRTLMSILQVFYCDPAVSSNAYRYSPSGLYFAPPDGTYDSYLAYVRSLPISAEPEVFGLHANADITKDQQETDMTLAALLLMQGSATASGGASRDEVLSDLADDIQRRVPLPFDIEAARYKYPVDYHESMNTVLCQELVRFNGMLEVLHESLKGLQKALKGLVLMSDDLEKVGTAMYDNKVPALWMAQSYPSRMPLASYVNDLIARCTMMSEWIAHGPPPCFWITGFYFTHAFLTGVKQNFARKHKVPIDTITFSYECLPAGDPGPAPSDGAFISGMFVEGARWDAETMLLAESHPKVLFSHAPAMKLSPCVEQTQFAHYECPLYRTPERRGVLATTGHSTNFVMELMIPSDRHEDHW
ncbi:hypothetical protein FOA52_012566 [Chlamydomonas sp. UWO 241]|nr:hypothetical protein FOA52_012566 [Chlamydomonas sp. UWO 241]